jgi:hypothetical protein
MNNHGRLNIFSSLLEFSFSRVLNGIALGSGLDDRGFVSRQGLGIFV